MISFALILIILYSLEIVVKHEAMRQKLFGNEMFTDNVSSNIPKALTHYSAQLCSYSNFEFASM